MSRGSAGTHARSGSGASRAHVQGTVDRAACLRAGGLGCCRYDLFDGDTFFVCVLERAPGYRPVTAKDEDRRPGDVVAVVVQAEGLGKGAVGVGQDGKLERELVGQGFAVLDGVDTDGDELNVPGLEFAEAFLQLTQLRAAVASPVSAVEGDDCRLVAACPGSGGRGHVGHCRSGRPLGKDFHSRGRAAPLPVLLRLLCRRLGLGGGLRLGWGLRFSDRSGFGRGLAAGLWLRRRTVAVAGRERDKGKER